MNRARLAALVASTLGACESTKPRREPAPPPTVPTPIDAPPADAPPLHVRSPDAPPLDAEPPYVMTPTDRINAMPATMVSRDGKHVLLRIIDDDGARGDHNLAFHLRDRKDQSIKQQVVIALDEKLADATRDKRIAAAEALIAAKEQASGDRRCGWAPRPRLHYSRFAARSHPAVTPRTSRRRDRSGNVGKWRSQHGSGTASGMQAAGPRSSPSSGRPSAPSAARRPRSSGCSTSRVRPSTAIPIAAAP